MVGLERIERVLRTGTSLTVVGQAVKDDTGTLQVQCPRKRPFYITRHTTDKLIGDLEATAWIYKVASYGFAVFGVILIAKHSVEVILERWRRSELHRRPQPPRLPTDHRHITTLIPGPPQETPSQSTLNHLAHPPIRNLEAEANRSGQEDGENESGSDTANRESSTSDERLCVICLEQQYNTVIVPCGHMCCCTACSSRLRSCPLCRARIREVVRTYPN